MELGQSTEMQNDVMVLLAKHVIATVANGSNFVFSPMSVNLLLCLIAVGSSCVSKQQILTFLMSPSSDHLNAVLAKMVSVVHANGTERSDLRLSMATGVWIDQSLSVKPSFKEVLENSFKGNCSHVDFFNKVTSLCFRQLYISFYNHFNLYVRFLTITLQFFFVLTLNLWGLSNFYGLFCSLLK